MKLEINITVWTDEEYMHINQLKS